MTDPAPVTRRRSRPSSDERPRRTLFFWPVIAAPGVRGPHVAASVGPDVLDRITPHRARKLADRLRDLADYLEGKNP